MPLLKITSSKGTVRVKVALLCTVWVRYVKKEVFVVGEGEMLTVVFWLLVLCSLVCGY